MEIIIAPTWDKFVKVYNDLLNAHNNDCYESIRVKFNIPTHRSLYLFYNSCNDKEKYEIFTYMKNFHNGDISGKYFKFL